MSGLRSFSISVTSVGGNGILFALLRRGSHRAARSPHIVTANKGTNPTIPF